MRTQLQSLPARASATTTVCVIFARQQQTTTKKKINPTIERTRIVYFWFRFDSIVCCPLSFTRRVRFVRRTSESVCVKIRFEIGALGCGGDVLARSVTRGPLAPRQANGWTAVGGATAHCVVDRERASASHRKVPRAAVPQPAHTSVARSPPGSASQCYCYCCCSVARDQ